MRSPGSRTATGCASCGTPGPPERASCLNPRVVPDACRAEVSYGDYTVRIALIAMSGVRAHSEKLTRLGMTLPGFVERSRVIASLPSLSLLTLAGMPPDRFDVSYHEVADLDSLAELPDCDLAAISTFTAQVKDAYALAARFRERGVATVLGGLHATAMPAEAAREVDAVVVGEGELSWPAVLD